MVKQIKTKAEWDDLHKENPGKLIVVDFFATWCGPCKTIAPKIAEFETQFSDVVFVKVDVDENEEVAEKEGISAMPTFKLYRDGKEVAEVVGASEAKIKQAIEGNK